MRGDPTSLRSGGAAALAAGFVLLLSAVAPAKAQLTFTEDLDARRTEAWAMRWFNALATPTGFGVAASTEAWSIDLGLEGGVIPSLSESDRRVGFNGTKVEDFNRSSLFGRPVVRLGLPGDFSLSAGWVPPIDFDGVEANLFSLALARPLWTGERGRLGAQLFYLDGTLEGDITCPESEAAPGAPPNPDGYDCEEVSNDTMSITSWGLELGYAWSATQAVELFVSGLWQELDSEFQVRARYNGLTDRSRLLYSGDDWAATAGIGWQAHPSFRLAAELFYSPLDVIRDPDFQGPSKNDPLFNFRLLGTYKLH